MARETPAPRRDPGAPRRIAYFDDACGFCCRCRDWLHQADSRAQIRFIARRDTALHLHAVTDSELAASLVVFDTRTGQRWRRARAVAALAAVLPLPWSLLRWMGVPGVASLMDRAYDHVARHRGWLSRHLGHDRCELDSAAVAARGRDSESVRG